MLKQFNFRNFLSFDETLDHKTHEFSMLSGKVKRHPDHIHQNGSEKLLSAAVVYGANASGKSNLITALSFMQICVLDKIQPKTFSFYNRNSQENQSKFSYFEVEIVINKKNYIYGFEAHLPSGKFQGEWLVERNPDTNHEKVIFERDITNGTFECSIGDTQLKDRLEIYLHDDMLENKTLFLQKMATREQLFRDFPSVSPIREVFNWFKQDLKIIKPNTWRAEYFYLTQDKNIHRLEQILASFDTGIKRIEKLNYSLDELLTRMPPEMQNQLLGDLNENKKLIEDDTVLVSQLVGDGNLYLIQQSKTEVQVFQVTFVHDGKDGEVHFSLYNESDGTQRLIDLADLLLESDNSVYVIDELDRCLHPNMTYHFLSEFLKHARHSEAQLICTSHTSCLLDFELIRRDEIWFVSKDQYGNSELYSLEEYNERFDRVIEKAYLSGRYGAVPNFTVLLSQDEAL